MGGSWSKVGRLFALGIDSIILITFEVSLRVITTETCIFLSARTASVFSSKGFFKTFLYRNTKAFIAWFWVDGATFLFTARSVRNASIFFHRPLSHRVNSCRECARIFLSNHNMPSQYELNSDAAASHLLLHPVSYDVLLTA